MYPTRPTVPVLRDLTFVARAGQTTALVGPSGCGEPDAPLYIYALKKVSFFQNSGKSTCVSLLLRLYNPSSGRISLNGQTIDEYNIRQLRQHIGVVNQEPVCQYDSHCASRVMNLHRSCLRQLSMKTFVMGKKMQQNLKLKKQQKKPVHTISSCDFQMLESFVLSLLPAYNCFLISFYRNTKRWLVNEESS